MSLINITNVSAGYTKENVIDNISFEINEGELVGVLGENGSGKSTLAKAVCNILPHSGNVIIDNNKIENLKTSQIANFISYVPQHSGIGINISVLDVVMMGFNPQLRLLEKPNENMKIEAGHILDLLGLTDKANTDYMLLSEGQKQLTILARSLISKGNLLVLDEPESALDFNVRIKTLKIIREWILAGNRAGIIILHDLMLALNYCDKLVLIKEKRNVAIVDLHTDSLEDIESKLKLVYGEISLLRVKNKVGKDSLIMLYDSEDT